MNANSNVGIHEIKTDIDKAMNLSKYQIDLYLSPEGIMIQKKHLAKLK